MLRSQGQNGGAKVGHRIIHARIEGALVQGCLVVRGVRSSWSLYVVRM